MRKILALIVIALVTVACAPAREPATDPATLPPDTVVTSLPVIDPTLSAPADQKNTGTPTMPFSPNPSDTKLERGNVFISESGLMIRESYPVQIALVLSGELPTPCHQLRVHINPPDAENKIQVEVYTVFDPTMNCIQVLKPFQENVELGTFPSGHYTVWVNESQVGEFDS